MPNISEAEVFFELFLPVLCQTKEQSMRRFKGRVELAIAGDPPRSWILIGGKGPWVSRAEQGAKADVKVTFSEAFVIALVRGENPDLDQAADAGEISFEGNIKLLEALDLSFGDAAGVVGTMAKRPK